MDEPVRWQDLKSVLTGPIWPVCGKPSKVAGSRGAHEMAIVLLQMRDGGELIGCDYHQGLG